jgi:nitroreductase
MTLPYALDEAAQNLLFRDARTANTFAAEPVGEEAERAIVDLMKWAPTSMNSQPMRIVWVRSDPARERLLGHLSEGNRPKTAGAPLVAVLALDTAFHDRFAEVFPHFPGARDLFLDDDRRVTWGTTQAWMQAAYFVIAVRAAGYAAGPMMGFDSAGLDADLLAGTGLRSICVVNIGKPGDNAWQQRLPRLAHDTVCRTL